MKKLLVVGLSACLLFSFTGSAFAASQTNSHVKKNVVHTAHNAKKTLTNAKAKKNNSGIKSSKAGSVHKKVVKKAKKLNPVNPKTT
ncbi:hypothetical protein SAMN04487897_11046 [Paenibacillus sp. yr247]|uniref:hypothetical protein n=1 Tax=Paenibacillus sp. yr247 TaxID=1761880 RepID=UPI0008919F2D|nr:hypothetical protein [Paenibacillus sp. yr247]SDO22797.1 hypothetical protein SAMN04487897_11046 [Paenibacillus sp. yr247]